MDAETLALLIPVLALSIPVLGMLCWGAVRITRHWSEGMSWLGAAPDEELVARVDEMQRDLVALRHELAETQERLDFAERLLARSDFTQALPGHSQPPAT